MTTTPPAGDALDSVEHVVVLMLENRSFDHMLGYLYQDAQNVSPAGQPFEGLDGSESNPDPSGGTVAVRQIDAAAEDAYYSPGADPGEGFVATQAQLYGASATTGAPTNQGFVTNYESTLAWERKDPSWSVLPGTTPEEIMAMFTPLALPVLSSLARGFAVCDHWFSSAPTETLPNRAFASAATSQGHVDDKTRVFTAPSIFGLLSGHGLGWAIYGYDSPPLTRHTFTDVTAADESHFGQFSDFQAAAAAGKLPAFSFLEPSWESSGNSQHPNYDVALGEALIHDVYRAVRDAPTWDATLLFVTYDEHGGCFDHVPPPSGATPPDASVGEYGFDFTRFGVRVPTVLVSPFIEAGTVFALPAGATPLDHTSLLKTVERRWSLPSLTARDAAAVDVGAALNLAVARTDDPLAGVTVPVADAPNPSAALPSHLLQVHADLVSRLPVDRGVPPMPHLETSAQYSEYIRERTAAWQEARHR